MKQLKFRIWNILENKWCGINNEEPKMVGDLCCLKGIYLLTESVSRNLIVQQHIGLKDKNKKEIYEGDILASSSVNGFRFLYRVEFYEGSFLKPYIFRQMADGEPEVVGRANNNIDFNILTVVGNIFCDEFKMLD